MNAEELPLLEVFVTLKERYRLSLGITEYITVVSCLRSGIGIDSKEDLEALCCLIWSKSQEDEFAIKDALNQMWIGVRAIPLQANSDFSSLDCKEDSTETDDHKQKENEENKDNQGAGDEAADTSAGAEAETLSKTDDNDTAHPNIDAAINDLEPIEIAQSYRRRHRQDRYQKFTIRAEYLPVTKRQMIQNWRYLRRYIRRGTNTELDILATVQRIGRQGIIGKPVMVSPKINQASIILMIDQNGSMMPFHTLSRQLSETATTGARFKSIKVFYFHNCPGQYLYSRLSLSDPHLMTEVMDNAEEGTSVLVVSDAGAARGNYNDERVKTVKKWISQMRQSIQHIAWLNPMPIDEWKGNSAEAISQLAPMFEMSREGMSLAHRCAKRTILRS